MITFACPSCSQSYKVSDDKVGKRTTCKQCHQPLVVPEMTETESEPDWELIPEVDDSDESTADVASDLEQPIGVGPVCPQCSSNSFAFKPIYGPAALVAKVDQEVAKATESFERHIREKRAEADRRLLMIEDTVKVKRASALSQGDDIQAVLNRAQSEREGVRVWLAEQEQGAKNRHEEVIQRIKTEYPVQSKNRLYLVYCTGCGHIVSATPAAGNLQEELVDVKKAVNRLHNTVVSYIQAKMEAARARQRMRTIQAGLQGLNALFNE